MEAHEGWVAGRAIATHTVINIKRMDVHAHSHDKDARPCRVMHDAHAHTFTKVHEGPKLTCGAAPTLLTCMHTRMRAHPTVHQLAHACCSHTGQHSLC